MKKTISIQISGILFHVDDDAYAVLDEYLRSIHDHFATFPDRDEIVSDIESRIAEQFSETLTRSKQVITLKDLKKLTESMGTVEDFAEFESVDHATRSEQSESKNEEPEHYRSSSSQQRGPKRFFRDTQNRVLAGVCAGIAAYFEIDPVIVRIIFFVFTIVTHGFGILLYIILWIAMPEAKTPTQRMEMQGEAVTLSAIQENLEQATKNFDVHGFTSVYGGSAVQLRIREGKSTKVTARAPNRQLSALRIYVDNGELHVERSHVNWLRSMFHGFHQLSIDIVMPELTSVIISGASRAEIEGFKSHELTLRATGASTIRCRTNSKHLKSEIEGASMLNLTGTGETIDLHISGASKASASNYHVKTGYVEVNGACRAEVSISQKIEGFVTGASNLLYYGSPEMKVTVSGASNTHQRGAREQHASKSEKKADADASDSEPDLDADRHYVAAYAYDPTITYAKHSFGKKVERGVKGLVFGLLRLIGRLVVIAAWIGIAAIVYAALMLYKTNMFLSIPFLSPQFATPQYAILFEAILFAAAFLACAFLIFAGKSLATIGRPYPVFRILAALVMWPIVFGFAFSLFAPIVPLFPTNTPVYSEEKSIDAQNFVGIAANGNDILTVRQGSGYSVLARGTSTSLPQVLSSVDGDGILHLHHDKPRVFRCPFCRWDPVEYIVTLPTLTSLDINGAMRVDASTSVTALTINNAGVSRIILSGSGQMLTLHGSGISNTDARAFTTTSADVELSGISRAQVTATQDVQAKVSGISHLFYSSPVIHINSSGLSHATALEQSSQ